MTENKKPSLLMTLGAAVLLIGGGVAAYWLLVQRGPSGPTPVGATVVPQDALITVSLTTTPSQWQRLQEFGTTASEAAFNQMLAQVRDRLLAANGYNYEKDIQPWIGEEVMLAFLSPLSPAASTLQTPPPSATDGSLAQSNQPLERLFWQSTKIFVLPIANPNRARQVLAQPSALQAGSWVERTYQNFTIRETQGKPGENYSVAILDGKFLVVTNSPRAMDLAIDTYKGGTSLATTPGYAAALTKIPAANPLARIFLNVPVATDVAAKTSAQPFPPQTLSLLTQNQGTAMNVTLEAEGLRFQGVSWLNPNSEQKHRVDNNAKTMPLRLPADTLMMMADGNLQQLWENYKAVAESNPNAPYSPQWLQAALQRTVNLDLEKDLLAWMGGEFSLSLIPVPPASPTNVPVGLVFMVQSNNRRAAERALKQLDELMANKYQLKVGPTKINDQEAVQWTSPNGALQITHGWLEGNVAFLTLGVGTAVADRILPRPTTSLAESPLFRAGISASELEAKNGLFFWDLERNFNPAQLAWPQLPPDQQLLISAIRGIGISGAIESDRLSRYDLFVLLNKVGKTRPAPSPTTGTPPQPAPSP